MRLVDHLAGEDDLVAELHPDRPEAGHAQIAGTGPGVKSMSPGTSRASPSGLSSHGMGRYSPYGTRCALS